MSTTRLTVDHTAELELFCPRCDALLEEIHLHRTMVTECEFCGQEVEFAVAIVD